VRLARVFRRGNGPAVLAGESLGPPPIQRPQLRHGIESGLHPARTAGLQWYARQIEPDIDAGHHALRQTVLVGRQTSKPALEARILSRHEPALQPRRARV